MRNQQSGNDIVKPMASKEFQPQTQNEGDNINNAWDYEEILKILGFGKTQWILILIGGLLMSTSVFCQLSVGFIAMSSQCEFNMTQNEKGIMMTAYLAGKVISTYVWGHISDLCGRRTVLIWTTFVATLFQLVSMFVTNIWLFNVINFIIGISLGGMPGALYAYLSELNTAQYRPVVINYSEMFVSITAIYVPAATWLVQSTDWSIHITKDFVFKPWRLIILFGLWPGLIASFILLFYPESPKLLLAHGKQMEAVKAINWISKFNTGKDLNTMLKCSQITVKSEEVIDRHLLEKSTCWTFLTNIWKSTKSMFHKPHGLNVLFAILCVCGLMSVSNGMQIWFPEIVSRFNAGTQQDNNFTVCELISESYSRQGLNVNNFKDGNAISKICLNIIATQTYKANIIMGIANLIGFLIQGIILNPLGRKNIFFAFSLVGALCGILLHVVTNTTGVLILFCLYILLPGLALCIMLGAIGDLVPTHLRGKVISLAFALGRLGLIVNTNLVAAMLEAYCDGVFGIMTGSVIVCAVLMYFLPI